MGSCVAGRVGGAGPADLVAGVACGVSRREHSGADVPHLYSSLHPDELAVARTSSGFSETAEHPPDSCGTTRDRGHDASRKGDGGESGIRTHGTRLTYTRFPSV